MMRHTEGRKRREVKYAAGILAFLTLIAAALWLPQLFFGVQDRLLYGDVSLAEQEPMDVLALSIGYEESLYQRMANFAEGLAGQRRYYVDEQDKEITESTADFLYSSDGLFGNLLPEVIYGSMGIYPEYFMGQESSLADWKQYVIYSDDYAQGVNFILWYFKLSNSDGYELDVLMDAQDHTVYAMKIRDKIAKVRKWCKQKETLVVLNALQNSAADTLYNKASQDNKASHNPENAAGVALRTEFAVWLLLDTYYEIFDAKGIEDTYYYIEEFFGSRDILDSAHPSEMLGTVLQDSAGNDVEIFMDAQRMLCMSNGSKWFEGLNNGCYYKLPFQGNPVTFEMAMLGDFSGSAQMLDTTIGIREIYELIPEFQRPE